MGEYADVSSKRCQHLLKWLERKYPERIRVVPGGKHNIKVECVHSGDAYPLPTSHGTMNKHIVKHFMEWLVAHDVCTKAEFDDHI